MASRARPDRVGEQAEARAPEEAAPPQPQPQPLSPAGMLWLQGQVGNQALARYVNPGGGRGTPPSPQFLDAARANEWLDGAPMRTLNSLLNLRHEHGDFTEDTFDAIEFLAPASPTPGVVDDALLEELFRRAVDRGQQTQFAHLMEQRMFSGMRLSLSLRFDPALATTFKAVPEGPLNAVTLGPTAFTDLAALEAALGAALPALGGPAEATAPALLSGDLLKAAVEHNKLRLTEFVSGSLVADAIGGHDTDPATEAFAQWIGDFQTRKKLPLTGKLDNATMEQIAERLRGQSRFSSLLRLVIDWGVLDRNLVTDVRFNPGVTAEFWIDRDARGVSSANPLHNAVTLEFGPKAFLGNFAGIVHTIADAFKQVEARSEGLSENEQKMLGKAEQLIGRGHGDLQESLAALRADVRDFVALWRSLRDDDRSRSDPRLQYLPLLKTVVERTEERFKLLGVPHAQELRQLKFHLRALEP